MKLIPLLLLVFASLVNGCESPISPTATPAMSRKVQEDIIKAIKNLGGKIIFDGSGRVYSIDLQNTEVTDSFLVQMKELYFLEHIRLSSTRVTDSGLVHLKELTNLSTLSLNDCQVTDSGLENLKRLTRLKMLWLSDTQVTDAGLVHLKGLTNLKLLFLNNTKITKAGVNELQAYLPQCRIELK